MVIHRLLSQFGCYPLPKMSRDVKGYLRWLCGMKQSFNILSSLIQGPYKPKRTLIRNRSHRRDDNDQKSGMGRYFSANYGIREG